MGSIAYVSMARAAPSFRIYRSPVVIVCVDVPVLGANQRTPRPNQCHPLSTHQAVRHLYKRRVRRFRRICRSAGTACSRDRFILLQLFFRMEHVFWNYVVAYFYHYCCNGDGTACYYASYVSLTETKPQGNCSEGVFYAGMTLNTC